MTIEVREVSRLGPRSGAWDALAEQASPRSPFLRSWWLHEVSEATPVFVLVLEDDVLLGGVALRTDRWLGARRTRMLGGGVLCGDHLDAVHDADHRATVCGALADWFAADGPVLLDLAGLVPDSLLARALGVASGAVAEAPYGVVPDDLTGPYLATRSRNLRRSAGRADRRAAEQGYVRRGVSAADLPEAMAWFAQLHRVRDDRAPLLAELDALERCLLAGLAAGEARVDVLQRGSEAPVAVSVAFWVDRRLSLYQVARSMDPEHRDAGTVLIVQVVEDAVEQGCVEIDLLRGDEGYKTRLVDRSRALHRVRLARGVVPRLLLALLRVAARIRSISATRSAPAGPDAPGS